MRALLKDPQTGELPLWTFLAFACLVRLPAVFFSRGYDFLDHQFQYIDPAYYLGLGGSWWRPHDYVQGLRSWVYPGFLAGMFHVLDRVGLSGAVSMMVATRFLHGVMALLPMAVLWTLLIRWKGWRHQTPVLLFLACNAFVVYGGVQPTGPTFAAGIVVTSILAFHGPGRLWPLLSGLLLGLAFTCRFQDAFFGPVLLAAGLLQRRWTASVLLILGSSIMIAFQGFVDLLTWGSFLHSPLRYVAWNVFEGKASSYGEEPFWYYLPFVILVLLLFPPFLRSGFQALATGARRLPIVFAAAVFYLFMHSLVLRKAPRFILPAGILLLIVYAVGLFEPTITDKWRRWHQRVFVGVHVVVLVFASFWYPHGGPIEAALELSRRDDFVDRLLIVGDHINQLGGHYYLRRETMNVDLVARDRFLIWLEHNEPETPLYVLVARDPIEGITIPPPYELTYQGRFTDWPSPRSSTRRFLYRLESR